MPQTIAIKGNVRIDKGLRKLAKKNYESCALPLSYVGELYCPDATRTFSSGPKQQLHTKCIIEAHFGQLFAHLFQAGYGGILTAQKRCIYSRFLPCRYSDRFLGRVAGFRGGPRVSGQGSVWRPDGRQDPWRDVPGDEPRPGDRVVRPAAAGVSHARGQLHLIEIGKVPGESIQPGRRTAPAVHVAHDGCSDPQKSGVFPIVKVHEAIFAIPQGLGQVVIGGDAGGKKDQPVDLSSFGHSFGSEDRYAPAPAMPDDEYRPPRVCVLVFLDHLGDVGPGDTVADEVRLVDQQSDARDRRAPAVDGQCAIAPRGGQSAADVVVEFAFALDPGQDNDQPVLLADIGQVVRVGPKAVTAQRRQHARNEYHQTGLLHGVLPLLVVP